MGLKEIKNNTPLNPLLIEGTLVGLPWVREVEEQGDVVFSRILRVFAEIKKSPLERGVPVRQLADRDGVCQL